VSVNTVTGELIEAPLSAMERSALTHAEAKIENGIKTFVEVGQALAEVREGCLYRETHSTFEAYCTQRWGLSRSLAYDTIAAAETVREMSAIADTPIPANVGQARELAGLPREHAAETMRAAHTATNGRPTARAIREAREITAESLAKGYVGQVPALQFFYDRGEYQRVNALGRDLTAMDAEERARRLETLDKTIAYEKRVESGESEPIGRTPAPRSAPVDSGATDEIPDAITAAVMNRAEALADVIEEFGADSIAPSALPSAERALTALTLLIDHLKES